MNLPASPFPTRKGKYQSSNKMNVSSNRIRLWWEINLYTSNSFVEKNGDNVSTCPPGSPFARETRCFLHRALLVFVATDLCSVIVTHCRFLGIETLCQTAELMTLPPLVVNSCDHKSKENFSLVSALWGNGSPPTRYLSLQGS